MRHWQFRLTFFATIQFLILTHLAMWLYKGGTIHEPELESYSFTYNFFSDLGRHHTPDRDSNYPVNLIFRTAMTVSAICMMLFFSALPGIFKRETARGVAYWTALLGVFAAVSYIGIAWVPYDQSYGGHRLFVRLGFVSFLLMSLSFAGAIFLEKNYPKRYAWALLVFSVILFWQLLLLFLGDRSWRSNDALFRQATAQKIVVYAEILVMLYSAFGVLRYLKMGSTK